MQQQIDSLKKTRQFFLNMIEGLSAEQLNKIPAGYNNNIIWHAAHVTAALQGVCYRRSGVALRTSEDFFEAYKPGSKPEHVVSAEEIAQIKELLLSAIDMLEEDYNNGLFREYTTFQTRYGVDIANINEAIGFIAYHEGMHAGYVMAMKHLV